MCCSDGLIFFKMCCQDINGSGQARQHSQAWQRLRVCRHILVDIYTRTHTHTHTHTLSLSPSLTHTHTHAHTHTHTYIYICICGYTYTYSCIYTHTYICIGKTYTIAGKPDSIVKHGSGDASDGIVIRSVEALFERIRSLQV